MTTTKTLPKEVQEKINKISKPSGTLSVLLKDFAFWYEERLEKAVNEEYIKAAMEAL